MSVQLIVYPQSYEGIYNSTSYPLTITYITNAAVFSGLGSTALFSYNGVQTDVQLNAINSAPPTIPNTWYRYHTSGGSYYYNITQPQVVGGNVYFSGAYVTDPNHSGIYQKLSNLTVGVNYTITVDFDSSDDGDFWFKLYDDNGVEFQSQYWSPVLGIMTENFNYSGGGVTVAFDWDGSEYGKSCVIDDIKIIDTLNPQNLVYTSVSDGQVICDLYEDEDIPLTLSIDDFKNVAEKVQSYSKAFNLPATKRNNLIFDNIFEITRTDTGLNFNPYKKTQCVLKQNGFVLFEGYLRLIDIQDKEGEISYNVNLYSEVVALADTLKDKKFSHLNFSELAHDYQKENIKWSWNDTGSGIDYINPNTSGFRDTHDTLKYPFINWEQQIAVGGSNNAAATAGYPELLALENAFRPCINIKYLIDRIFDESPFTYESDFFNTSDFKKLYMDFNWGADNAPISINAAGVGYLAANQTAAVSWQTIETGNNTFPSDLGYSAGVFTATTDNQWYQFDYIWAFSVVGSGAWSISFRWKIVKDGITSYTTVLTGTGTGNSTPWSGCGPVVFDETLNTGDTIEPQFKSASAGTHTVEIMNTSTTGTTYGANIAGTQAQATTSDTLLQTLRGDLGQWDFLKGLMTMFNLVTLPDPDNPTNILIETYSDVFINNTASGTTSDLSLASRGIAHDWTDKIDISEMKLTPLTDLNKKTIFKFVEDDDDYAFNVYKRATNHLYGSKLQDEIFYTVLYGEKEIVADPFAATVCKPLMDEFFDFITPAVYAKGDDNTWEGFDNSPRIFYNNGKKTITSCTYFMPTQNGFYSQNGNEFLQFSHLTDIPTVTSNPPLPTDTRDFHFGECQLIGGVGAPTPNNLFNLYWLPYYNELYNPDTRIMTIKVNLSPSDISTFKMYDTVFIKNRTFRVNKIDYKPNDLAKVEFILIP